MLAVALIALFVIAIAMVVVVLVQSARTAFAVYGSIRDALAITPDLREIQVLHVDTVVNVVATTARRAAVTPFPAKPRHRANNLPLAA